METAIERGREEGLRGEPPFEGGLAGRLVLYLSGRSVTGSWRGSRRGRGALWRLAGRGEGRAVTRDAVPSLSRYLPGGGGGPVPPSANTRQRRSDRLPVSVSEEVGDRQPPAVSCAATAAYEDSTPIRFQRLVRMTEAAPSGPAVEWKGGGGPEPRKDFSPLNSPI